MGVGEQSSNYLAASIVWLLKDGVGMIGRIVFTWGFAASLDSDCKQWHFIGDILNNTACILDLMTPYFQWALLIISSISSTCRAITFVIHGSTRAVIFQHQAQNNNVADVTAKCSSLETMISLIALFVNILLLSILPSIFLWPTVIILICGHLWANYQAKRCLLFNMFNKQRFHLICSQYFKTNGRRIPSVKEANNQESILFKASLPHYVHIGMSLNQIPKYVFPTFQQLEDFHNNDSARFLLVYNQQKNIFYGLLKPNADNNDIIRLNFYIEVLSYAMKCTIDNSDEGVQKIMRRIKDQLSNLNKCLDILQENDDHCYEQFKTLCRSYGYVFHQCLFNVDIFRLQ